MTGNFLIDQGDYQQAGYMDYASCPKEHLENSVDLTSECKSSCVRLYTLSRCLSEATSQPRCPLKFIAFNPSL